MSNMGKTVYLYIYVYIRQSPIYFRSSTIPTSQQKSVSIAEFDFKKNPSHA